MTTEERRQRDQMLRRTADGPLTAHEDSLKSKYLARLHGAKMISIYEFSVWRSPGVIDLTGRGRIERIAIVGQGWRDSLVRTLSAPRALGPPVFKFVTSAISSMAIWSSQMGTDTVWFDTSQHVMHFVGAGPLYLGYDNISGPLHYMIHTALDRGERQGPEDVLGVEPYDIPPLLQGRPMPMPATTGTDPVFCLIRIGVDGHVKELKAPAGQRLPNPGVCAWLRGLRYYPATKNSKVVESWVPIGIRPPPLKK